MKTVVWEGRFLTVVTEGTWEYAERKGQIAAAVIVAVDGENRLVLVEQHRIPVGKRTIELPAGLIGDEEAGESVATGARRELEEETGFRADSVEELGLFYSSPGMTSECFTIVRATGLTRVGDGGGDAQEDITVHLVPVEDVPAFISLKRAEGLGIDAKILLVLDAATM
ncbi:NUDIX hydrolase [Microvirga sp. SRT01]|uniref:GDP-mannose pyrophosphatase n=1 Tax=Sphingomonas longa TaxID=2778730 RepID=A0ABS2DBM5_9SPHN|nr:MULTISPECIES: NUDIX hydrolase [Alphaproteobacteria]MBM6577424.1 NUDIX hydrolase [Sphingomonas sp. BT552]MBR7710469.1 NUDIX hydrolase [Microvirga sp. SRT01]